MTASRSRRSGSTKAGLSGSAESGALVSVSPPRASTIDSKRSTARPEIGELVVGLAAEQPDAPLAEHVEIALARARLLFGAVRIERRVELRARVRGRTRAAEKSLGQLLQAVVRGLPSPRGGGAPPGKRAPGRPSSSRWPPRRRRCRPGPLHGAAPVPPPGRSRGRPGRGGCTGRRPGRRRLHRRTRVT